MTQKLNPNQLYQVEVFNSRGGGSISQMSGYRILQQCTIYFSEKKLNAMVNKGWYEGNGITMQIKTI
jgi:hypothetical protein